jgi:hypothetical protein
MSYGRQREKLREELTLAQIDHHADAVDELDVRGILAFAERVLPRASDLWVTPTIVYTQPLRFRGRPITSDAPPSSVFQNRSLRIMTRWFPWMSSSGRKTLR